MEPERIELSARERERLKVLHEVEQGHLKQIEAARDLRFERGRSLRLQFAQLSRNENGCGDHGEKSIFSLRFVFAYNFLSNCSTTFTELENSP